MGTRGQPEAPATHVSGSFRARADRVRAHQSLVEHAKRWLGLDALSDLEKWRSPDESDPERQGVAAMAELVASWRLYDWVPAGEGCTLAAHWLAEVPLEGAVDADAIAVIRSASSRALSFYQVRAVDPARGLLLRNLLGDEEAFVVDALASESIPRWAVLLARLVEVRGLTYFEVAGIPALPPDTGAHIARSVEVASGCSLPLSVPQLRSCGLDLIEIYGEGLKERAHSERRFQALPTTRDGTLLWPDTALPALGGLTPRQAVATTGGRDRVEALLRTIEYRAHGSASVKPDDFDGVRRALGLLSSAAG